MATTTSLLDWILSLLRDPAQQAAFQADPQAYASEHGFGDLSAADVHDALCLAGDNQSQNYRGDHDSHVHYPPPHHYEHGESATHYLSSYITNNYTSIDERSTNIDNSVHERVDTHGGDFSQNIHNDPVIASGDGAVAAGHDIRDSTLTTGDRNVVGDNNQAVTGNDNTTAFGSGAATNADLSHASFGDGAAASIGGSADGHSEHNATSTDVRGGSGATSVNAAGTHATADTTANQDHTDSSTHNVYDDHTHTDSHNELNSHDQSHFDDSHNTDIHHA